VPTPATFTEDDQEYSGVDPSEFDDGDALDSAGIDDEGAPE
jgi:hypothetical protein